MKIQGDGYLSIDGRAKAKDIFAQNSLVFDSLNGVLGVCRSFLKDLEVNSQESEKDRQKIIAIVVFVRLLEVTEAAFLLARNGISQEVNSLLRVFLDAYFVFANVCADTSFVSNYFKSDETVRLKLMNSAEKHKSELFAKINLYATDELKSELNQKIRDENIQAFNSFAYADNVGYTEIYDSIYRLMSASIHTTPRSLEKYVEEDEKGNILEVNYCPIEDNIPQRIYDFTYFMIKALTVFKKMFDCLVVEEIAALESKLNKSIKTLPNNASTKMRPKSKEYINSKTDITVLILRFIFGAILGGLLTLVVVILMILLNISIPKVTILMVGGVISLIAAIFATIWGDRFLMGFMKIFKIFKYFP